MSFRSFALTALSGALALSLSLSACAARPSEAVDAPAEEEAEKTTDGKEAAASEDESAKAAEEAAAKAAEEEAAKALEEEHAAARAAAESEGLSVFTGTVRVMSGTELCAYEEVDPDMNGDADVVAESTYVILVLDGTEHVVGMGADGSPREGDADHIGIGKSIPAFSDFVEDTASAWVEYDGQRICVAGKPWFQTDVSLPFAPRMDEVELLYAE